MAEKKSVFEFIIEILGWVQIVASPVLIGLAISFIVIINWTESEGAMIVAIFIPVLGLFIGIIWATHVWKRKGTIEYVSRLSATPELDNLKNEEDKNI